MSVAPGTHDWLSPVHAISVAGLVGVVGGVLWHALSRREVVDRLNLLCLLFVLATLIGFFPGASIDESADTWGYALLGVFVGVLLTEKGMRLRDQREVTGRRDRENW